MRFQRPFNWVCEIFLLACCTAGVARAATPPPAALSTPPATAFLHVNVVPMDQERVLPDQTVLVEGGRITRVGASATVKVPRNARRIDARGKYLIPGLVDSHVHLQSQLEFPLYLANGVTTVFNLDGRPGHLLWRKQITAGEMLGPTIFTTGPIFHQKRSADEDIELVDEQATAGYDAIKVYNEVSREEYPALINEAKKKNLLLMGHVARGPGFAMTLAHGQSIAHMEEIAYTCFNPQNDDDWDHPVFDDAKIPAIARQTKDANIFVTATLNHFALIVEQATDIDTFLKNPELRYVAPWTLENFQPANDRYRNRFGPERYAVLRNLLALQRKLLKALNDQGVPLMTGTDATEVGPISGFGLHHELQEFVADGLTPYQALTAATTNPARYFHNSAEFGTVEAGKRADLLLLTANPLENIANTQKIAGVMVRGRWLDENDLRKQMDAVPAAYREEQQRLETLLRHDPSQGVRYLALHDPLGRLGAYVISGLAARQSVATLLDLLQSIRRADASAELVSEDSINTLGYQLMNAKLYPQAIAVLRMNTENYSRSANTWDSLADAFAHSGDDPGAVRNYQKALATDAAYGNADAARKFIAEHPQK